MDGPEILWFGLFLPFRETAAKLAGLRNDLFRFCTKSPTNATGFIELEFHSYENSRGNPLCWLDTWWPTRSDLVASVPGLFYALISTCCWSLTLLALPLARFSRLTPIMSKSTLLFAGLIPLLATCLGVHLPAQEYHLHRFDVQPLTDIYYSEGANYGDIDRDSVLDIVHGPFWFKGPEYKQKLEIYPAKAQPRNYYADNFFSWVHDFNGDGWKDVFTVGLCGKPAFIYENPRSDGLDSSWAKHEVLNQVCNESPQFLDITGDGQPELICTNQGYYGYATYDPSAPFDAWVFHRISDPDQIKAPVPFGHGLGLGDVDADGDQDILFNNGWFEQPESLDDDPLWKLHPFKFAPGGADMFAYDVDGDGDNDVITSLSAHNFGLAWYEQVRDGDEITFLQHMIMGATPEENEFGLVFSELHSVNLVDMDGDGLKDIVTGKTYWSHHTQSPMWDAGAVVYWFKLERANEGVRWLPFQAAADTGIGRQLVVGDLNGDGLQDMVLGGMKGANVLIHRREEVDRETWERAQPAAPIENAAGLLPDEAAKQMSTEPGFRVQLAAGEPQVHQPIAMTIDHRGRVWIAEAYTYPIRAPEGEGKDKIIILEDTNHDGALDSRKIFMEGLNLVSGLEVGFGGVWIGAAPYLMFVPDEDGDDQPDSEPQILLDGFGYQDTHETLNSFNWGPDGWLYGCHGVFTHSRVGKPGTADQDRIPMNAGVWRYHPVRHQFEVFAWGTSNPWGVDFNDQGQAFITACVIPHLWHIVQGARYHRQGGQHFNPYLFDDIKTIADHAHYAGNIRDHAWWGGKEPELPRNTSQLGGGHAHCGAMVYLGDNWPSDYRNQIFFNNIHGNRVNSDRLEREGSGYVGHHGPDLLMANDHWYRGINLRYGPDGSVYLIDWYDKNACHRRDPLIWDRTNGRVYNVAYGDVERTEVDLESLTDAELAELHLHANDWYVRVARRILQHRNGVNGNVDAAAEELLRKIAEGDKDVTRVLRAMWTLHALGAFRTEDLQRLLEHEDEFVRSWAIQLELEDRTVSSNMLSSLEQLAESDLSPTVRLYLASALQRLPLEQRWQIAAALISHAGDASDHNLPLMVWYGLEPLVKENPSAAIDLATKSNIPLVTRHILRRASLDNEMIGEVVALLAQSKEPEMQRLVLEEMLHSFEGRANIPMPDAWSPAYEVLLASGQEDIGKLADQVAVAFGDQRIFPRLRQRLADDDAQMAERLQALQTLVRGRDPQGADSLLIALRVSELRAFAIRALAEYQDDRIPAAILMQYSSLGESEKRDAINTLVARTSSAFALLQAIESNEIPRTDLHAYHVRQLMRLENDELAARIKAVWGDIRQTSGDRQMLIAQLKRQLTAQRVRNADVNHGRLVFQNACASCHKLFGTGGDIGPELTGSNRANLDYLLENIVDPSAVLGKDYRMTLIETVDGRLVSGLVTNETDSAVTLQTINDVVVIPKDDIEGRRVSDQSMMPDGLLEPLAPVEVRDLVAYLASPQQVALRGPVSPIDPKIGKVLGAIESEGMKIIGKSVGSVRAQAMGNFSKDRWSSNEQLFWTGAKPGAELSLEIPVEKSGSYDLEVVMTKARDYGVVELRLDGQPLGGAIDLYTAPDVLTTGVLTFRNQELNAGEHALTIKVVGANPEAKQSFMFGLDYVRLVPVAGR